MLTKRGAAAQSYLNRLQSIPANALKIGDKFDHTGVTLGGGLYNTVATVTAIEPGNPVTSTSTENGVTTTRVIEMLSLTITTKQTPNGSGLGLPTDMQVRLRPNTPENVAKALEYQATLTKTGTVRKTKTPKAKE